MNQNANDDLLCLECHQPCGTNKNCSLAIPGEDHIHLAGGIRDLKFCLPCEEKFLARHRPIDASGNWKWLGICQERCRYCGWAGLI